MSSRRSFLKSGIIPLGAICLSPGLTLSESPESKPESELSKRLKSLNRQTRWTEVSSIKVQFTTFHCQGMVKIGNEFWISSVEVRPSFPGDRSHGLGHLFRMNVEGQLLADLVFGELEIYHPSGIDFDGTHIWMALAEYKPNSKSIIYRVDPWNMSFEEVFRWDDHIGSLARDPDTNTLHGVNWGSRLFYQWELTESGQFSGLSSNPKSLAKLNHSSYIDYQDNQYLGGGEMLYSGLAVYRIPGKTALSLGGIELIDLKQGIAVHQIPLSLWSPNSGSSLVQNPSFFESYSSDKVRGYFIPDDNESILYVYQATVEESTDS